MRLEPTRVIQKYEFIRLLARKADFTIGDTKIFWQAIEEIFQECIETRTEVKINGFGHLFYTIGKERDMINPKTLEKIHVRPSQRVAFRLSVNNKAILRPDKIKKPWVDESIENFEKDYGDLYDIAEDK